MQTDNLGPWDLVANPFTSTDVTIQGEEPSQGKVTIIYKFLNYLSPKQTVITIINML